MGKRLMNTCHSLISELEDAIKSGPMDNRVETLRRVTDLFVTDADRFSDEQIAVFDDVLGHLIDRIETKALAQLSRRLAPIERAPAEIIRRLAHADAIAVAAPVLAQSGRLTANDLVDVARTKSQAHLLAISGRTRIEELVTDVLLQRGDREVVHRLASNSGARFSESGFETLVKKSEADGDLAEIVGLRRDIPLRLFRELLQRATETVRSRLLASASPENQEEIRRVLSTIASHVDREATVTHDYAGAQRSVLLMQRNGTLNEAALLEFAKANRYAEMVAALSLLCSAPFDLIDHLLHSERKEVFLIPCKAAGFEWPTVRTILSNRSSAHRMSDQDLDQAKADYINLSKATAQRVLRFWQVRQAAAKQIDTQVPLGLAV